MDGHVLHEANFREDSLSVPARLLRKTFKSARQKLIERRLLEFAMFKRIDHDDRQGRVELCQNLAARTARRDASSADDDDRREFLLAGGDCSADRDSFGAVRQTEGYILDVDALEDLTACGSQCGADWEV